MYQLIDRARVVDGYVGCRIAGKEDLGLASGAHLPHGVQQLGDGPRIVNRRAGRCACSRGLGLVITTYCPQGT